MGDDDFGDLNPPQPPNPWAQIIEKIKAGSVCFYPGPSDSATGFQDFTGALRHIGGCDLLIYSEQLTKIEVLNQFEQLNDRLPISIPGAGNLTQIRMLKGRNLSGAEHRALFGPPDAELGRHGPQLPDDRFWGLYSRLTVSNRTVHLLQIGVDGDTAWGFLRHRVIPVFRTILGQQPVSAGSYCMGRDQVVCHDYALSGQSGDFAYGIVCAGKRKTPDAEFGVRVLALAARETLRLITGSDITPGMFGTLAIRKAMTATALFPPLDEAQAFDATLLVAWVHGKKMRAYIFGNGLLVHAQHAVEHAVHVGPCGGLNLVGQVDPVQPDYLSLEVDEGRKKRFSERARVKSRYDFWFEEGGWRNGMKVYSAFEPVVVRADVKPGEDENIMIEEEARRDETILEALKTEGF